MMPHQVHLSSDGTTMSIEDLKLTVRLVEAATDSVGVIRIESRTPRRPVAEDRLPGRHVHLSGLI